MKKIVAQFGDKTDKMFKAITADNGSEFATLGNAVPFANFYFAHPYSSFERGTNEKQNSLIRRIFPKGKVWKMYLMMLLKLLKIGLMHFQEKGSSSNFV